MLHYACSTLLNCTHETKADFEEQKLQCDGKMMTFMLQASVCECVRGGCIPNVCIANRKGNVKCAVSSGGYILLCCVCTALCSIAVIGPAVTSKSLQWPDNVFNLNYPPC